MDSCESRQQGRDFCENFNTHMMQFRQKEEFNFFMHQQHILNLNYYIQRWTTDTEEAKEVYDAAKEVYDAANLMQQK